MRRGSGLAVVAVVAVAATAARATTAAIPAAWTAAVDIGPVHEPVPWSPGMPEFYPEVHVASGGELTAFAWTDLDGTGRRLRARIRTAPAATLGPILDVAIGDARLGAATATAGGNGDVLFTWGIRGASIQGRRLSGGQLGPVVELAHGDVSGINAVAMDDAGNAVIAYDHVDKRVQLRTLSAAGVLGRAVTIPTPGLRVGFASVAVAASGRAIVAWDNANRDRRRLHARTASVDGRIGPVLDLWAGRRPYDRALYPQLAIADDGAALAAWMLSPNAPDKPFDRVQERFVSAAGRLGPTETFPRLGRDPGYAVAMSPSGRGVIMWRQGAKRLVRAALLSRSGRRGPAVEVSDAEEFPRLSIDAGAGVVFAWGTDDGVYARSLSPDAALGPVSSIAAPGERADGQYSSHALALASRDGQPAIAWSRQGAAVIRGATEPKMGHSQDTPETANRVVLGSVSRAAK
jgi:hypothetical protein